MFGLGHEELADQKYFIFLNLAVHHNYSLGLSPRFFFFFLSIPVNFETARFGHLARMPFDFQEFGQIYLGYFNLATYVTTQRHQEIQKKSGLIRS